MNVIIERNHLHLKPCIVIFFSCKPAKLVILCGWFVCGWDGYFKCAVRTYRKPVHSYGTVLNVQGQYYRQFLDEYCHGTIVTYDISYICKILPRELFLKAYVITLVNFFTVGRRPVICNQTVIEVLNNA